MLLSNVMRDQPPEANTMSAAMPDVNSSGQDDIRVTGQAGCLNQSLPSNNVEPLRDTGKISKLYIIARTVPLCTRNGQDVSFRPLQHDIWCLVSDTSTGRMKFMLLCECQDMARSGVDIEDVDCGEGIHPVADEAWMQHLIRKGKWSKYKAEYVTSRTEGQKSYSTVFFRVIPEHRALLVKIRRALGYPSDTLGYPSDVLVRIPRSKITRVKQKKRISKLMTPNSEDPAPCKHRVLPVDRHSRGARSVARYKRKASKPNSKNGRKMG
jgi:hypothetical protein